MDKAALKIIVDEVFAVIEAAEAGHPVMLAATRFLHSAIDSRLDSLAGRLASKGVKIAK